MSSNTLTRSISSSLPTYESNQQHCQKNTRTRSSSSASDDPTRRRMTYLTTRLKNAFKISHQPTPTTSSSSPSPSSISPHSTDSIFPSSAPMQVRSFSLPSHQYQQQSYYFSSDPLSSTNIPKSRPLSCVIERPTDVSWMQEDNAADQQETAPNHHVTAMELDSSEIEHGHTVPGLIIDSACSSTVSEVDSFMAVDKEEDDKKGDEDEEEDIFVYEQQTEWVNTAKHWYSDYVFPFNAKSVPVVTTTNTTSQDSVPSPKQPQEGILKPPSTVLGKRPMSTSTHPTSPSQQHDSTSSSSSTLSSLPSVLNGNGNGGGSGPFHKKKKRTPVIRFDKMVQVHATYSQQDYNRQSDPEAICTRLNATLAHQIKQELNLYKTTEMSIHEQSKVYTQLFC
ncbi:hypothetical protein BCR42DRAFT_403084 [Absidia repens]|uniref:Uncharacterized protein n=1 Tax=Absidia repens TaxID=90262 RepID=A0A1X2IYY5_9FUNG|nr:hypothetical protein BCR42DRAFT_403084 [Absidia repens]